MSDEIPALARDGIRDRQPDWTPVRVERLGVAAGLRRVPDAV